ncbi:MAG: helix-turn-helix transcriptional regulator [Burkholderiales bacterium]
MGKHDRFDIALRRARKAKGLTQEDFAISSSRTYVSMLERGVRSPTLAKVGELADTLDMHPLSLLTLAYLAVDADQAAAEKLLRKVQVELASVATSKG